MWKLFVEYDDKSKATLTGKHKEIPLELALKYRIQFHGASSMVYQQYPKKEHDPMTLDEKIREYEIRERKTINKNRLVYIIDSGRLSIKKGTLWEYNEEQGRLINPYNEKEWILLEILVQMGVKFKYLSSL